MVILLILLVVCLTRVVYENHERERILKALDDGHYENIVETTTTTTSVPALKPKIKKQTTVATTTATTVGTTAVTTAATTKATTATTTTTATTVAPVTTTTTPTTTTEPGNFGEFRLTAYCSCKKCCGKWAENRPLDENGNEIVYTASGAVARSGHTIAVDPDVIPFGTKVEINGQVYVAQDTGSAIVGNRIDVYFDNHSDAHNFGVKYANVYLLGG